MISEQTASRIRDLRSQGYTQEVIAKHLRVSRATIVRVMQGKWRPRQFQRRQVARLLQLWQSVTDATRGSLVGECSGCGEPVSLPCVPCLARVLDLAGVRVPVASTRMPCDCGGNYFRLRRPPAKIIPSPAEGKNA
jgi:DNA-binding XRE family transcriptional regulator